LETPNKLAKHKQVHPPGDLFVGNHQGHPGAPNQSLEFLSKKNQYPRRFFFYAVDWGEVLHFKKKSRLQPKTNGGGEIEDARLKTSKVVKVVS